MKIRIPDYFNSFKCIASQCEDTCCAGWEIVVDDETYDYYKSVKGRFGERLKKEIIKDEEGDNIFVLNDNRCAFLDNNDMCDIYKELGEKHLCYTCREYPRFTEEFGSIREIGLSLSCPEAARIILGKTNVTKFNTMEDDNLTIAYNDISYDIFIQLSTSRNIIMNIIQERSISLNDRISIILSFSNEIQKKIDEDKIDEISGVIKRYSDNDFINSYINSLKGLKNKSEIRYNNMRKYFEVYKDIDHISEECPLVLDELIRYFYEKNSNYEFYMEKHKKFDSYYGDKLYEYEQIIVYFIFRYFMKAVYDYDVSSKIKFALVSMIIIKELDVVRWCKNNEKFNFINQVEIVKLYSKDIEHSEENIESLYESFEKNDIFSMENLLIIINN